MMLDQPLRFVPILQTRVWGGDRLKTRVSHPPSGPIGESWEVCDRDDAQSVVRDGPLAGQTLRALFAAHREELCGEAFDAASPGVFPLMLKLLDPVDDLSVQVHPDDAYAGRRKAGELGKTEAWYVLEAEPGARIYRGLREGVTPDVFRAALAGGTVADCLKELPARAGDVFHLPAGTVHALGRGVRIAEIQQNSDTTYRVFDWNRPGLDGKPRALHVDDALAVTDFSRHSGPDYALPTPVAQEGCRREGFVAKGKFTFERLRAFVRGQAAPLDTGGRTFHLLTVTRGAAAIVCAGGTVDLTAWDSALVPAAVGAYQVRATETDAELLLFGGGAGR